VKTYQEWLDKNKRRLAKEYCNDVCNNQEEDKKDLRKKFKEVIDKIYNFNDIPGIVHLLPDYEMESTHLVTYSKILGVLRGKNIDLNLHIISSLKNELDESKKHYELMKKRREEEKEEGGFNFRFRLFNPDFDIESSSSYVERINFINYLEKITTKEILNRDLKVNVVKNKINKL
jgi:hypothetical protein